MATEKEETELVTLETEVNGLDEVVILEVEVDGLEEKNSNNSTNNRNTGKEGDQRKTTADWQRVPKDLPSYTLSFPRLPPHDGSFEHVPHSFNMRFAFVLQPGSSL